MRPHYSEQWLKDYQAVAVKRGRAGVAQRVEQRFRKPPVGGAIPLASSKYRSKWESFMARDLALQMEAGEIVQWWYEPFSLWLPGKIRYKPDFLIWRPYVKGCGSVQGRWFQMIEVKGWSKNRRDGMTRLKMAAAIFPCFHWTLARWTGRSFEVEEVVV